MRVLLEVVSFNEVAAALKSRIITATSGPMTSVLAQVGRTTVLDVCLDEFSRKAIQPSVRAKAYRSQFEGKMVWTEGRKWEWTEIQYCKGRFVPIVAERELTVTSPFVETLRMASNDRSPIVRRVAAEMLIRKWESLGEESLAFAKRFASDPSPSVAERGRFALEEFGAHGK